MPLGFGLSGGSGGDPQSAIENALQAWVTAATGLDNAHVRWIGANVTRPTDGQFFCMLEVIDRVPLGAVPEVIQNEDLTRVGQEEELQHVQILDCGFRVQVFAPPARGLNPGVPGGSGNAAFIAERIRLASALTSIMDALDAVGVSVYDRGKVHYVPAVLGADFEGRAVLDIRFYVADSLSEFTGYIDSVHLDGQVTDEAGDILDQPQTITAT